jgi:hypothetical protein
MSPLFQDLLLPPRATLLALPTLLPLLATLLALPNHQRKSDKDILNLQSFLLFSFN